jgi:hypothetical protein
VDGRRAAPDRPPLGAARRPSTADRLGGAGSRQGPGLSRSTERTGNEAEGRPPGGRPGARAFQINGKGWKRPTPTHPPPRGPSPAPRGGASGRRRRTGGRRTSGSARGRGARGAAGRTARGGGSRAGPRGTDGCRAGPRGRAGGRTGRGEALTRVPTDDLRLLVAAESFDRASRGQNRQPRTPWPSPRRRQSHSENPGGSGEWSRTPQTRTHQLDPVSAVVGGRPLDPDVVFKAERDDLAEPNGDPDGPVDDPMTLREP